MKNREKNKGVKKYLFVAIPIALVAIVVGAFAASQGGNTSVVNDTPRLINGGAPILGNPDAKLTLVEWGDYQCTYCHRFHENTKDDVMHNYVESGKIRFTFRDFTLNGQASVLAAEAAYCADDQGKYWNYHDELYKNWAGENTGWVTMYSLSKFASNVGLDLKIYDKCMEDHKYNRKVLENYKFGQGIGVNATPTFFIVDNEGIAQVITGAQPYNVIDKILSDRLKSLA